MPGAQRRLDGRAATSGCRWQGYWRCRWREAVAERGTRVAPFDFPLVQAPGHLEEPATHRIVDVAACECRTEACRTVSRATAPTATRPTDR